MSDETDREVVAHLEALDRTLVGLGEDIERENELRTLRIARSERTQMWLAVAVVLSVLVGIVGIVVGAQGRTTADSALGALRESQRSAAEARLGSCLQQRVAADVAIVASQRHDQILADKLEPPPRSPVLEAQVRAALAALHASDVSTIRKRDCSPEGIAQFLSGEGGYEAVPKP